MPLPDRITVKRACEIVGGDRPIDKFNVLQRRQQGHLPQTEAGGRVERLSCPHERTAHGIGVGRRSVAVIRIVVAKRPPVEAAARIS
jgi:hypothetical protein